MLIQRPTQEPERCVLSVCMEGMHPAGASRVAAMYTPPPQLLKTMTPRDTPTSTLLPAATPASAL